MPDARSERRGPDRVTLYPHAGDREWSSKMWDAWKREMGEDYLALGALLRDLGDPSGALDSVIGQAVTDARDVGGGIIATARAVREALAEHFAAEGQDGGAS